MNVAVAGANGQLESAQPQAVQNENTSGATVETKNTSTETNQKSAIANSGLGKLLECVQQQLS